MSDIKQLIVTSETKSGVFAWFDQTASGPSIIAILSNSEKLAYYCNMTTVSNEHMDFRILQRNCIYSEFLRHCNANVPSLNGVNFADFNFDRKWAKYTLMTHYYSAGLETASRLASDWVTGKNLSNEDIEKYEGFFNKKSKIVKSIRQALLDFCPQATMLSTFFKKIALVAVCNEELFLKLTKAERQVIIDFRVQLLGEGATEEDANRFCGFGFNSLVILSPFGTKIEYSLLDKNPTLMVEFTNFRPKSGSVFAQFNNQKARFLDRKQMVRSFLVNFIHSCDASILQQLVK